jgi:hypothetical protein
MSKLSVQLAPNYFQDQGNISIIEQEEFLNGNFQSKYLSVVLAMSSVYFEFCENFVDEIEEDHEKVKELFNIATFLIYTDLKLEDTTRSMDLMDTNNLIVQNIDTILKAYCKLNVSFVDLKREYDAQKLNVEDQYKQPYAIYTYFQFILERFKLVSKVFAEYQNRYESLNDENKREVDKKHSKGISKALQLNEKQYILVYQDTLYTQLNEYVQNLKQRTKEEEEELQEMELEEKIKKVKAEIDKFRTNQLISDKEFEISFTKASVMEPENLSEVNEQVLNYYELLRGLIVTERIKYVNRLSEQERQNLKLDKTEFEKYKKITENAFNLMDKYQKARNNLTKEELNRKTTSLKAFEQDLKKREKEATKTLNEAQRLAKGATKDLTTAEKLIASVEKRRLQIDVNAQKLELKKTKSQIYEAQDTLDNLQKNRMLTFEDVFGDFNLKYELYENLKEKKIIKEVKSLLELYNQTTSKNFVP